MDPAAAPKTSTPEKTVPLATVPPKLAKGDLLRVIAPAASRAMVAEHDHSALIERRFAGLGLRLSYGRHVDERDIFDSTSVASRVADLHDAFADPEVKGILTVIGGFNSNELLPYLDWDLIAANPKILCGYSDITALQNAIFARTGLVTYSGPHWSSFGMRDHFDLTQQWFVDALVDGYRMELAPSAEWIDDAWFLDQDNRSPRPGSGWWNLQQGAASGRIIGGNLCTLNLLQGTAQMPPLAGSVLMLEDDEATDPRTFARDLTSLLQQPDAEDIQGLVIGRFQASSGITLPHLQEIAAQPALAGLPVLANVDFGHTQPQLTLPIGGRAELTVDASGGRLRLSDR
ncbi:LD-carboxypeptidase [Arthrobacter sp. zg-Y859]|uniref:LD-carboxypeptidase n=1 Tax=Arthrobacter jinronghuae TaxID=2964609 RepID=A0ABT1NLN9_9MICC|nr:S66 peptidase family protein [Arthrobacter jinronghuae]MCQ1948604.1 LD-carboxypeptidase [Arthrobacter jinronghuae]UWX78581.1 LD-carboxypeptidase [Arthrobacter jinronghuae]